MVHSGETCARNREKPRGAAGQVPASIPGASTHKVTVSSRVREGRPPNHPPKAAVLLAQSRMLLAGAWASLGLARSGLGGGR